MANAAVTKEVTLILELYARIKALDEQGDFALLKQEIAALDYQSNALFDQYTETIARREHAEAQAAAEKKALLAKCRALNR